MPVLLLIQPNYRIYTLEKEVNQPFSANAPDPEASPLLNGARDDPDRVFAEALDRELEKITSFYDLKEPEIFQEGDELLKDEASFDVDQSNPGNLDSEGQPLRRRLSKKRSGSVFQDWGFPRRRRASGTSPTMERIDSGDSDGDEEGRIPLSKSNTATTVEGATRQRGYSNPQGKSSETLEDISDRALSVAYDAGATLKKRMISLYVSLSELRSFVQLNKTGFLKVLKKYDKTLDRKLRNQYISQRVDEARTFRKETSETIGEKITQLERAYALHYTQGNEDQAKRELRLDLREHVVWERNTVWREMIGIERKAQAANLGVRQTILGGLNEDRMQGDEEPTGATKEVHTFAGRYRCPHFLLNSTFYFLVADLAIFAVLLAVPIMDLPEQQNCLALVVFVSLLWATEVSYLTMRAVHN